MTSLDYCINLTARKHRFVYTDTLHVICASTQRCGCIMETGMPCAGFSTCWHIAVRSWHDALVLPANKVSDNDVRVWVMLHLARPCMVVCYRQHMLSIASQITPPPASCQALHHDPMP